MRSRAILTAAATAAAFGGGLASAGTAAATTAPLTTSAAPRAPQSAPTPGVLAFENALQLGDGWCVAPLHWSGSLAADPFPSSSDACGEHRTEDGVHVLSNLCIAPISADDPSGPPAAPPPGCAQGTPGSGFEVLRNVSVAGVQATF